MCISLGLSIFMQFVAVFLTFFLSGCVSAGSFSNDYVVTERF